MGAEQIRDILHHRIEQADEHFLQAMLVMVEAYTAQNDLEDAFDTAGYQAVLYWLEVGLNERVRWMKTEKFRERV